MLKRFLVGAVALAALALSSAGCSGDDTTILLSTLAPSLFPGNVLLAKVSKDGRALTDVGEDVDVLSLDTVVTAFPHREKNVVVFAIRARRATYLMYRDSSGAFGPAVQVRVERGNDKPLPVGGVFLNTANYSLGTSAQNSVARARDGDFVAFFTATQTALLGSSSDNDSTGLFSVYFDVSLRTKAFESVTVGTTSYEFNHGFQAQASRVDGDVDGNSGSPGVAAYVGTPVIVSDSIHGTQTNTQPQRCTGEPTTFLVAAWQIDATPDDANAETRWHYNPFVLTADGYTFTPGQTALPITGMSSTVSAGDDHKMDYLCQNGVFVSRWTMVGTNDDDEALVYNLFRPDATNGATVTNAAQISDADTGNDDAVTASIGGYLGADDCLTRGFFVYREGGVDDADDGNNAVGSRNEDDDIMLASFVIEEESDATLTKGTVAGTAEIDPFVTRAIAPPNEQDTTATLLDSAVARDASWFVVTFSQVGNQSDKSSTLENKVVKAVVVDSSRHVGNATAQPFSAAIALTPSRTVPAGATPPTPNSPLAMELQDDAGECICGFQSNVNVLNWIYSIRSGNDTSVTTDNFDLRVVRLEVTLSSTAVPAAAAGSPTDTRVDAQYNTRTNPWTGTLSGTVNNAIAFDRGTAAGEVGVVYRRQISNAGSAPAGNDVDENGIYLWDGSTTPTLLHVDGTNDAQQALMPVAVVPVPRPTALRVNNSGNYTARAVHLFFTMERNDSTRNAELVWRKFTMDNTLAAAGQPGGSLDTPTDTFRGATLVSKDEWPAVSNINVLVDGSTVDVYFLQDNGSTSGHVWYQHYNGSSWIQSGGKNCAQIVDNCYAEDIEDFALFPACWEACDDAVGATVFWDKLLLDKHGGNDNRRLLGVMRR